MCKAPVVNGGVLFDAPSDTLGGLVPWRNKYGLIAYYVGLLSFLFCIVGLPGHIAAIIFGVMGVRAEKRQPWIHGRYHAIAGIVFGFIGIVMSLVCIILFILSKVG